MGGESGGRTEVVDFIPLFVSVPFGSRQTPLVRLAPCFSQNENYVYVKTYIFFFKEQNI